MFYYYEKQKEIEIGIEMEDGARWSVRLIRR